MMQSGPPARWVGSSLEVLEDPRGARLTELLLVGEGWEKGEGGRRESGEHHPAWKARLSLCPSLSGRSTLVTSSPHFCLLLPPDP